MVVNVLRVRGVVLRPSYRSATDKPDLTPPLRLASRFLTFSRITGLILDIARHFRENRLRVCLDGCSTRVLPGLRCVSFRGMDRRCKRKRPGRAAKRLLISEWHEDDTGL